MHADYRHDPFTDAAAPLDIVGEVHMIPASSPYTIRLNEVPLLESPSSVSVRIRDVLTAAITTVGQSTITVMNGTWFANNDVILIDNEQMLVTNVTSNTLTITRGYNGTTAATHLANIAVFGKVLAEVAATPAAMQYWPDYSTGADQDDEWNTGTVQFNSADAGKIVAVTYKGTGTLAGVNPARSFQAWMNDYGDGSDGHFISSGSDTIDGVKQYKSFVIQAGHTVNVGDLPLTLLCQGAVVIKGTLNGAGGNGQSNIASPTNGVNRGGATKGVMGNVTTWEYTQGGTTYTMTLTGDLVLAAYGCASGGGGTFRPSWWRGMQVAAANATPASQYQLMMALAGEPGAGCRGKATVTDADTTKRAGQGGSGGSIVIACKRYRNAGTLSTAAGSNGGGGSQNGGAGGGGAAIKIVAPSVSIESGGVLTAAGGNGGTGQNGTNGGTPAAGWSKVFEMGA